jgi:hypothetical protein
MEAESPSETFIYIQKTSLHDVITQLKTRFYINVMTAVVHLTTCVVNITPVYRLNNCSRGYD